MTAMGRVINKTYKASITREHFLFYEMRITARLLNEGCSEDEVISRIVTENLFQYPTERSIKGMAKACLRRLTGMNNSFRTGYGGCCRATGCIPPDLPVCHDERTPSDQ